MPPSQNSPETLGERPPASPRRIVFAWLAVAAWAGVIWQLGGDDFSAPATSSKFLEILRGLGIELDLRTRYQILIAIRKSAHFVEYAILSALAFRAAWLTAGKHRIASAGWTAIGLVLALACADELRQAYSTTRTGSPYDVLLDATGGVVALLALLALLHRLRARRIDGAATTTEATPTTTANAATS